VDALAELFAQELERRDLTDQERAELVDAFRRHAAEAQERLVRQRSRTKLVARLCAAGAGGAALLALLVYLWVARPFTPVQQVESDLQHYLERVEAGYGAYADRYYRLLRRFDRKLGSERALWYEERMYAELDEHYRALLEEVSSGDVLSATEATRWSGYFPEREERRERRREVRNLAVQGVADRVEDTVQSVIEGARGILGPPAAPPPPPVPSR
jgi:hypothetical protein